MNLDQIVAETLVAEEEKQPVNIQPLSDYLVVRPKQPSNKLGSGILVAVQDKKDVPTEGEVIAAGYGYDLENGSTRPMKVKVGDNVIFKKFSGIEIKENGEDLLMLSERDLIATRP